MTPPLVGTLAWAERSGGALSRREQFALAREAIAAQVAAMPSHVRRLLRGSRWGRSALATGREPPDSALARVALELAREVSPEPLLGHCQRCWLWADLFAQLDGVAFEPELLYVSCLLHDLGLTDRYRPDSADAIACFAVCGGEVARRELANRGAEEEFCSHVAEAITLHMNVRVPRELGDEAYLLHAAAHLDVAGTRSGQIPRVARRDTVTAHPRLGFPTQFAELMRNEAAERPRSRAALLWRLGMRLPLLHNPLDRLP